MNKENIGKIKKSKFTIDTKKLEIDVLTHIDDTLFARKRKDNILGLRECFIRIKL